MSQVFKSDFKKLESKYYELAILAWNCTPSECAEFVSGCLDLIAEAKDMIRETFDLYNIRDEHLFEYLYNDHLLPTNYASFDSELGSIEVINEYGKYSIHSEKEEDIDIEDIMVHMESLVNDLSKL